MQVFIVYWHPEPKSFNRALFRTACEALSSAGHDIRISDLHAMRFEPISGRNNFTTVRDPDYLNVQLEELHATEFNGFVPELNAEMDKLKWCELMIWQFPLWWFALPAAFKGWVDRVFAMGCAYGNGRKYAKGMFRGKRALLSLTTGGPEEAYRLDGANGNIEAILRPIHRGMLQFVGFDVLAPHIVYGSARMTEEQRKLQLAGYAKRLTSIGIETPIAVGPY